MSGPSHFTDAILLRSVDYGEADRILTFLTRSLGKVSLIARGARRSQKRFAGALEPFALVRAEIASSRGALGRLGQAQLVRGYPRLLTRLDAMNTAGRALELVRELTPEQQPDLELFDSAVRMLQALDEGLPCGPALACYSLRVLALSGFAPRLDSCVACGRAVGETQSARFDPRRGSVVCRACGGGPHLLGASARRMLQLSTGEAWHDAAAEVWPTRELEAALLAIDAFVEHRLERST